jgi:type IV pilus assembly protein PilY1
MRTAGLVAASLILTSGTAHAGAADLELFSSSGNVAPNIMILLDTSGSMDDATCWGCDTKRVIAKRELKKLVRSINDPDGDGVYEDNARFGLMGFRVEGAMLQHPIQANGTAAMLTAIDNSVSTQWNGSGTPISGAALDIMRYLAGPDEPMGTIPAWGARSGEDAAAWTDPWDLDCRKTYVIYISDGEPTVDKIVLDNYWVTIGDADGQDGETSADVGVENFPFADDIAAYAADHDFRTGTGMDSKQNVIMHVIGFAIDHPLLKNMAADGGGDYYTTSATGDLATALGNITTAVYDDQAAFSTAVVPTSRTLFDAAFYNAYFVPDGNEPMWSGHLDAYALEPDGTIKDKDGNDALDATGAFADPPNPFWDAGEELAGDLSRALYTNKAGSRVDFVDDLVPTITSADLGISGISAVGLAAYPNSSTSGIDTEAKLRTALLRFLYGLDGFDRDDDSNYTEPRAIALGDIFHSSPSIVGPPSTLLSAEPGYTTHWSTYKNRDRVIYVGANDGMLHAFHAGNYYSGDDPGTTEVEPYYYDEGTGEELFGFIPGDMLSEVKNVPRNSSHGYYFVDGSPVVADAKIASGWATVLVTGMREGGDSYLALDVTDPNAGAYPGFLWEFTDPDLGQTWSEPVITRVRLQGPSGSGDACGVDNGEIECVERWVAIFGGGYTPNDEGDPNSGTFVDPNTDATGRAIYMVALDDGSLIAKVAFDPSDTRMDGATNSIPVGLSEMKYALPSTPAVLDTNFDGFADVVYIGDLGGQMWKWDIKAKGSANWEAGIVFKAPATAMGGGVYHYRNFFFPPTASFLRGSLYLAFGSGERQDLRGAGDPGRDDENRFYVVRDRYPTGANRFQLAHLESDLDDITTSQYDPDTNNAGYYIKARESEKWVNEFGTFAGYIQATSYVPTSTNPCSAASGESYVYQFRLDGGSGFFSGAVAYDDQRRQNVGAGLASAPRVSMSLDPSMDQLYVKTSKGKVITVDPPTREGGNAAMIYWKQNF